MSINQDVQQYATGNIGTQIGDGECFTLADRALRRAGARSAAHYGTVTANADYVWGRQVSLRELVPGDVIQFRNYRVTITTVTTVRTQTGGGGWSENTQTESRTDSRPHHTAIVDNVRAHGSVAVLEQNVGSGSGRRKVQRNTLYFTTFSEPPRVTRRGRTTTTVHRNIEVRGTVRFYRPQAAE